LKKTILAYGGVAALLILLVKFADYRFMARDFSTELYIGVIAAIFAVFGIWVGLKFARTETVFVSDSEFKLDEKAMGEFRISSRELEVLKLMSEGLSNQEIADKLFISLNTVKTHSSSLFSKLDVKRRTQAVQRGKDLNLIG